MGCGTERSIGLSPTGTARISWRRRHKTNLKNRRKPVSRLPVLHFGGTFESLPAFDDNG